MQKNGFIYKQRLRLKHCEPDKKVWSKLDRNDSIQFNTVFANYVSIQKSIQDVKGTDWNESTYRIGIKT